jgi:hypothetical protein
MDESTDRTQSVAYSVAAIIGTTEKWKWLEERWNRILKREAVTYFKNSECLAGIGAFVHVPDETQRLSIRQELENLCISAKLTVIGITVEMAAFRAVVDTPAKLEAFSGGPYFHCYCTAIAQCALEVNRYRPGDVLAFGYDEDQEHAGQLTDVYRMLKTGNAEIAACLSTIAPFDDKTFVPIQAADLYAALVRRFSVPVLEKKMAEAEPDITAFQGTKAVLRIDVIGENDLAAHLERSGLK